MPEQGLPIIQCLHKLLATDISFLKPVRTQLQDTLFDFYLNKSSAIRTLARELALQSQTLFD